MARAIAKPRWAWTGTAAALFLLHAWTARAQGEGTPSIEVHGIASQGFLVTTDNEYLVQDSERGSFQMSELGINFSKALTDRLRFGVQFFAQNFGAAGDYIPRVDWFYLDYSLRDWLGVRAGRLKIPFGLYNEVNDIDAARVPVLLPQSVYALQTRSFLFAQTGGEVYGFARSRVMGALDYRLWGGTIFIDPKLVVPVGTQVELKFNVPWAFGGRVLWETPVPGLRLGGSLLKLRLDTVAFLPMMMVDIENNSIRWVASADFTLRALTVTAEYARGHTKQETVLPGSNVDRTGDAGYVMVSYLVTTWFQPALYYALTFPDVDQRDGLTNKQHDVSLTLRFDINQHWLVKLEGHYMAGTVGLENPLRVTPAPADPERHWAVFLAKTTAYF
jgi:hypothetical protein